MMIPAAIFLFLAGAVLAWAFRVWVLVPICLISMMATVATEVGLGAGFLSASGQGLLVGLAPQFGYAFGLLTQATLLTRYAQRRSDRKASISLLYKRATLDRAR